MTRCAFICPSVFFSFSFILLYWIKLNLIPVKKCSNLKMCVCMCVYLQGQYRKALSSLHQMAAVQQPQPGQQSPSGQASLEHHRALIQQASCHYALGEYRVHTHTHNHTTTRILKTVRCQEAFIYIYIYSLCFSGYVCCSHLVYWNLYCTFNMPQKLVYHTNWPAGGAVVKVNFRGTNCSRVPVSRLSVEKVAFSAI